VYAALSCGVLTMAVDVGLRVLGPAAQEAVKLGKGDVREERTQGRSDGVSWRWLSVV
jgi:hypothetical protein